MIVEFHVNLKTLIQEVSDNIEEKESDNIQEKESDNMHILRANKWISYTKI